MKPLISVCCILNETDIIAKAFADYLEQEFSGSQFEIIIVDNGLSESARNDLSARKFIVLDGSGDRFDTTRDIYMAHATGEYILIIDADERITSEGVAMLMHCAKTDSQFAGYMLPEFDYTGYGNWAEHYALRFIKNYIGIRYDGREMHSSLIMPDGRPVMENSSQIYAPLHHFDCLKGNNMAKRIRNIHNLNAVLQQNENDATSMMYLGLEYVALKNYDEAEQLFRQALDIRPESNYTRYFYMLMCAELGRNDEAQELADYLTGKNKYISMCRKIYTKIAFAKGDTDKAYKLLLSDIDDNPYNPSAYLSAGAMLDETNPQLAITLLTRALMLNPMLNDPRIYAAADDITLYRIQNTLLPCVRNVHFHLAKAYSKMDMPEMAEYHSAMQDILC